MPKVRRFRKRHSQQSLDAFQCSRHRQSTAYSEAVKSAIHLSKSHWNTGSRPGTWSPQETVVKLLSRRQRHSLRAGDFYICRDCEREGRNWRMNDWFRYGELVIKGIRLSNADPSRSNQTQQNPDRIQRKTDNNTEWEKKIESRKKHNEK
jgi:hypothetical protein